MTTWIAALVLLGSAGVPQDSKSTSGKLFAAGGGSTSKELAKSFIEACGGPDAKILVLPQASQDPGAQEKNGSRTFLEENGAKNVEVFKATNPTKDDLRTLSGMLKDVKGIWMPGGQQGRIIERFTKLWLDGNVKPLLKKGVNFYGTSAGAMVMSDPMIYGPGTEPDTSKTGPGMGLTKWVIDTHFAQRKREPRLRYALKETGAKFGLGINEREWVVIQDDEIIERHGSALEIKPEK